MHRHAVLHDWANLIVLPIVVAFAIAGLVGTQAEQHMLVKVILAYVGIDTVWVFLDDCAVPGALQAIRYHHVGTLVLIVFPLLRPELAWFACLDSLTEINTFFLIARRQFKQHRAVLTGCYWATFVPVRLVLFPGLLFVFRDLPLPQWESIIIWTLQLGLCVFNIGMVHRSLSGWWRNRKAAEARKAEEARATLSEPAALAEPALRVHSSVPALLPAKATAHITLTSRGKVDCSRITGLFGTSNIRRCPSLHDRQAAHIALPAAIPVRDKSQTIEPAVAPHLNSHEGPPGTKLQPQQDWGAQDSVSCTGDSASSLGTPEQQARLAKLSDLGAIADLWGSSVRGYVHRSSSQARACG